MIKKGINLIPIFIGVCMLSLALFGCKNEGNEDEEIESELSEAKELTKGSKIDKSINGSDRAYEFKNGKNTRKTKLVVDFANKCITEDYDCECWDKKVKDYFKTDEAYLKYLENHSAVPDELIDELAECSLNNDFDF